MAVPGIDLSVLFLVEGGHWDSFTGWGVNFMNHVLNCIGSST